MTSISYPNLNKLSTTSNTPPESGFKNDFNTWIFQHEEYELSLTNTENRVYPVRPALRTYLICGKLFRLFHEVHQHFGVPLPQRRQRGVSPNETFGVEHTLAMTAAKTGRRQGTKRVTKKEQCEPGRHTHTGKWVKIPRIAEGNGRGVYS